MKKYLSVLLILFILLGDGYWAKATEKVRCLGMENGSVALNDPQSEAYAQYLNLDVTFPTVIDLHYAKGIYLAITQDGSIYYSRDLREWKLSDKRVDDKFRRMDLLSDQKKGFLLYTNKRFYFSKNGKQWKKIAGMHKFFSTNRDYRPLAFFNKRVFAWQNGKSRTRRYSGFTAVLSGNATSFSSDGKVLFRIKVGKYTNSNDGYTKHKLQYSLNGKKWRTSNIKMWGYGSEVAVTPDYEGKKMIEIYTYVCDDVYVYYNYTVKNGKVSFKKVMAKGENRLGYFKGELTPSKGFFNLCFGAMNPIMYWDDDDTEVTGFSRMDNAIHSEVFEKLGFKYDTMMLLDFLGNNPKNNIRAVTANNKLYYFGKYGGIVEIDKDFNQRWVGLYPRETLDKTQLADPSIGGQIGIIEKNNVLWYSNTANPTSENRGFFWVFSSDDGIKWQFEFSSYKIVDETMLIRK